MVQMYLCKYPNLRSVCHTAHILKLLRVGLNRKHFIREQNEDNWRIKCNLKRNLFDYISN